MRRFTASGQDAQYLCAMIRTHDIYYTADHEWIDFQGSVAYIGVCSFKLTGFREVQQINMKESAGFRKKSDVIATIRYNDYLIELHMPVDGKIIEVNESLVSGNPNLLLQYPEGAGWIAKIIPSQPYERKELLLPSQYQMNGKSKYAK